MNSLTLTICAVFVCVSTGTLAQYLPTWESLDKRPLPEWYDNSKIGIFIHWGVFSVPSFRSEWFWWYWKGSNETDVVDFMKKNYPPDFQYADFAPNFRAEFYDPDYWSDILEASGAKYVVVTTKHHEGFCMWPSKYSFNWNAGQVGPKRDLIGDLVKSIRNRTSLHFGLYHSLFEWFNPIHLRDAQNNYTTQDFVRSKSMPELFELIDRYEPDILWSDGDSGPDYYWNSTNFLAWLYNESKVKDTVVTNDRWGNNGVMCHHGGFYTCDDRYNPGKVLNHKWENCMTIDRYSWGYRRNAKLQDFLSIEELVGTVVTTVSYGGNVLINIGPTKEGTIAPIFESRLRQLGSWLKTNGEAIYETKPWVFQNDTINSNVWYTNKQNAVYAILLKWSPSELIIGAPANYTFDAIVLLGYGKVSWIRSNEKIVIDTQIQFAQSLEVAWTFKFVNIN